MSEDNIYNDENIIFVEEPCVWQPYDPSLFISTFWRCVHYLAQNDVHIPNVTHTIDLIKSYINHKKLDEIWEAKLQDELTKDWVRRLHIKFNTENLDIIGEINVDDYTNASCDLCTSREYVFLFPWSLIHCVAQDNNTVDCKDFLSQFDQNYPCDKCRNTLLINDILPNESVIDWTIRNRHIYNETNHKDFSAFMELINQASNTGNDVNN